MYMTIRKYRDMRSVPEAARRAEAELAPVLRRTPGFRGYYILDCGDGATASVTLFEGREGALAANERALAWVFEALADRHVGTPPEVTTGEVLVAVAAGGEDTSPLPAAVPARSEATATGSGRGAAPGRPRWWGSGGAALAGGVRQVRR